jgi:hypothetical protein
MTERIMKRFEFHIWLFRNYFLQQMWMCQSVLDLDIATTKRASMPAQ